MLKCFCLSKCTEEGGTCCDFMSVQHQRWCWNKQAVVLKNRKLKWNVELKLYKPVTCEDRPNWILQPTPVVPLYHPSLAETRRKDWISRETVCSETLLCPISDDFSRETWRPLGSFVKPDVLLRFHRFNFKMTNSSSSPLPLIGTQAGVASVSVLWWRSSFFLLD